MGGVVIPEINVTQFIINNAVVVCISILAAAMIGASYRKPSKVFICTLLVLVPTYIIIDTWLEWLFSQNLWPIGISILTAVLAGVAIKDKK